MIIVTSEQMHTIFRKKEEQPLPQMHMETIYMLLTNNMSPTEK